MKKNDFLVNKMGARNVLSHKKTSESSNEDLPVDGYTGEKKNDRGGYGTLNNDGGRYYLDNPNVFLPPTLENSFQSDYLSCDCYIERKHQREFEMDMRHGGGI